MKGNFKYYKDNKEDYIFTYLGKYINISERYIDKKLYGIAVWNHLILK